MRAATSKRHKASYTTDDKAAAILTLLLLKTSLQREPTIFAIKRDRRVQTACWEYSGLNNIPAHTQNLCRQTSP